MTPTPALPPETAPHSCIPSPFGGGLDLRPPLDALARDGAAFVPRALDGAFRLRLAREVAKGPIRGYRERFGQVRQQIEGFDVVEPFEAYSCIAELASALTTLVRRQGAGIRGLTTWRVNEAGVILYRRGSIGITPHLDGRRYRRLIAIVTISGKADLSICRDRAGNVLEVFPTAPGDLTLLRGPGLDGKRDGRPFHSVSSPADGERWAIGLRMATG